jgi:hypothetical protein
VKYISLLDTLCAIIQHFPLDFDANYRDSVKAKQLYEQLHHLLEEEVKKNAVPISQPHSGKLL